jgi:hypothetical protein
MINQRLMILLGFFVLVFSFAQVKAQSILKVDKIPANLIITLERTPCFGKCAAYKITINNNGKVIFEGFRDTTIEGKAEDKILRQELMQVIEKFETIKFFSLPDKYESGSKGCEKLITCDATQIISIQIGDRKKKIVHYLGCLEKDEEWENKQHLIELGKEIDKITNSKSWITGGK